MVKRGRKFKGGQIAHPFNSRGQLLRYTIEHGCVAAWLSPIPHKIRNAHLRDILVSRHFAGMLGYRGAYLLTWKMMQEIMKKFRNTP